MLGIFLKRFLDMFLRMSDMVIVCRRMEYLPLDRQDNLGLRMGEYLYK